MSNASFRTASVSDRSLVDAMITIAAETPQKSMPVQLSCVGQGISWNTSGDPSDVLKSVLDLNSALIDAMSAQVQVSPSGHIALAWNRSNSTFTISNTNLGLELSLKLLACARRCFVAIDDRQVLDERFSATEKALLGRLDETTARLQSVSLAAIEQSAQAASRLEEEILSARMRLEDQYLAQRTSADAEAEARRRVFETQADEERARLRAREAELDAREASMRHQDPRDARRALRETLLQQINAGSALELSDATKAKRTPVRMVLLLGIVCFGVMLAYTLSAMFVGAERSVALRWAVRASSLVGFATLIGVYLRWENNWFQQHAREEFQLRRLAQDVNRANWVVEAAVEWSRERNEHMPPQILEAITHGLFGQQKAARNPEKTDVISDLLKSAKRARVALPGGEVELDQKAIEESSRRSQLR